MTDKYESNNTMEKDLPLSENPKNKVIKPFKIAARVLVLVLAFVAVVFGTLFIADLFSTDDSSMKPEVLTVTVLGNSIKLNSGDVMSFSEFEAYIDELDERGELDTVALITDTANPPDVELYNRIVELMQKYGIEFEEIAEEKSASKDELSASPDAVDIALNE